MSDTALLLVLVALNLLFVSGLVLVRLTASGWPARRVWVMVAEMWAVFGLFIALFRLLPAQGGAGEIGGFAARFAGMPQGAKIAFSCGIVLTLGLFFHMLITLNRTMHRAPPEE